MNILVLNGSPRPHGNTAAMVAAFTEGAIEGGHNIAVFNVCQKHIAGCLACEYCHTKGERRCIQNDDMQEIYPVLDNADIIVLASPVYYTSICVLRIVAMVLLPFAFSEQVLLTAFLQFEYSQRRKSGECRG